MSNRQTIKKINKFSEYFFFSNYFYGICAVALSIEATLQQRFPVNSFFYFALIFLITVLYYAYPYIRRSLDQTSNPRTNWYSKNYNLMRCNQAAITIILVAAPFFFFLPKPGTLSRT